MSSVIKEKWVKKDGLVDRQALHIEKARSHVMSIVGFSNFEYNELFFDFGILVVKKLADERLPVFLKISSSSRFWVWYRIEWFLKTQQFFLSFEDLLSYDASYKRGLYVAFMHEHCVCCPKIKQGLYDLIRVKSFEL